MTSRPPLGVHPRQAQRSLSASGLSQRPSPHHQRSLSQQQQQYSPQSPSSSSAAAAAAAASSRRGDASLFDLGPSDAAGDGAAAAQGRYGTQRRGGSRLKLELTRDAASDAVVAAPLGLSDSPSALESSKPATPSSRLVPPNTTNTTTTTTDTPDLGGGLSPQTPRQPPPPPPPSGAHAADGDASKPLPMPPRRPRFSLAAPPRRDAPPCAHPAASAAAGAAGAAVKKDARPKPYSIEIPPDAPRYVTHHAAPPASSSSSSSAAAAPSSTDAYADFHPWTGHHPEDRFSEQVIRHGFFDKAPVAQTETASAKGALFAAVKHKNGLVALSTVFTGILGQRRYSGRITTPSTFKPPPRVTLTDTKREMWLRDLANPAISLRRLSRTIPHGIRGKGLLDQCLNKSVPVDRAVWLAKCVGANEIRAFKRKGAHGTFAMGGEAKWIRDWTVFVEQFVEAVFSAFAAADWKTKVNYAIRLATYLYAEQLLDRDHYTEWLVASLENSPQEKLPMWILLSQIYWKDMLQTRRYGRRLVTALLSHLHVVQSHPDRDLLAPLASKLVALLSTLMVTSPENFVLPGAWPQYHDTLLSSLPSDHEAARWAFGVVSRRNEQLGASGNRSRPAARHILVQLLDATLQSPMADDLPARCWNVARDKAALVRALLDWSTSTHRPGVTKVYVASRVLRAWAPLGMDATAEILAFLDADAPEEEGGGGGGGGRKKALYHLVCELVRLGLFSVSRYLQWLVARGGLAGADDVAPQGSCATRLLVELPLHALGRSQRSLRAGMLRRAGFLVEDEARDIQVALGCLQRSLGLAFEEDDGDEDEEMAAAEDNKPERVVLPPKPLPVPKLAKRIGRSSFALKSEVGVWLRDRLAPAREEAGDQAASGGEGQGRGRGRGRGSHRPGAEISPATFHGVRAVLEAAEDFSALADFLRSVAAASSHVDVLASATDTVNRHLLTFSAIGGGGGANELFDALYGRLKPVAEEQGIGARPLLDALYGRLKPVAEEQGIGARPLLASLASLAPRVPGMAGVAAQLASDLARSDRAGPVDACSPVSDSMGVRLLRDDAGDLHEEIEKQLASGTSVDRNTMDRFFHLVVARLQKTWGAGASADADASAESQRAYSMLLARLRSFDVAHFHQLMTRWVYHVRGARDRPSVRRIFPLLLSMGCLGFPLVLASAYAELPAAAAAAGPAPAPPPAAAAAAAAAALQPPPTTASARPAPSQQALQATYATRYAQDVLALVTTPPAADAVLAPDECYRIAILQDQAQREHTDEVLAVVRQALAEYALCRNGGDGGGGALPLDDARNQAHLIGMLRSLILRDAGAVARALAVPSPDPHVADLIDCTTTKLLVPDADRGTRVTFEQVLELTDEFTLPFCQVKLSLGLAAAAADQGGGGGGGGTGGGGGAVGAVDAVGAVGAADVAAERAQSSHLELFARAMDRAVDAKNITWTGMLASLGPEITHHLKARAQARFLDLLPSARGPPRSIEPRTEEQSVRMAENLLAVLEAIVRGGSLGRAPPALGASVVDKLTDLWEILSSPPPDAAAATTTPMAATKAGVIQHWLPSLLTFMALHAPAFEGGGRAGSEAHGKALIALCGILQELDLVLPVGGGGGGGGVEPSALRALAERVFDTAAVLADHLADDAVRTACLRAVREASSSSSVSDPRLRYLLSAAPSSFSSSLENLMLSHRDKQAVGAAAASAAAAAAAAGGGGGGTANRGFLFAGGGGVGAGLLSVPERLSPFQLRRWEVLNEPTPTVGENDTALSLTLFEARKIS